MGSVDLYPLRREVRLLLLACLSLGIDLPGGLYEGGTRLSM